MPPRRAARSVLGPEVHTSPEDKRLYRRVTLGNGLVALLIHDPHMVSQTAQDSAMESGSDEEEQEGEEEEEEEEDEAMSEEGGSEGGDAAPTKKAAIALSVSVGSFSDPPEAQGLSHFLEVR